MNSIKFLDKVFPFVMVCAICTTVYIYKARQYDFIDNSVNCLVVLDQNMDEKEKILLKQTLRNLTFQDVIIEEKNNSIYISIKCPPERQSIFKKFILDKYKGDK